ncbi:MAG: small subunit ribosomal protein S8 [Candidatus Berkelbacteria bacterium Licking1014_96]|uniref:Small ribosomal subunit protein uS8 n=1 Tax=Candidatus Berkelbacteria bacterium Licking1014_96 TaxID=2017149 RepID=A0A554LEH3_9BACT|nr:MAG: small subunit ribosomal protein S8 [Candidatus Berkelbacteria bacterium Licking1014_96]
MSIDPISNLIVMIKNGYRRNSQKIYVPFSKEKERILKIIVKEKYLKNIKLIEKNKQKLILIRLFYQNDCPAITEIKRISKPGQRIYAKPSQFRPTLALTKRGKDLGTTIISTSKGMMTTKEAKKKNIGGELILKVY